MGEKLSPFCPGDCGWLEMDTTDAVDTPCRQCYHSRDVISPPYPITIYKYGGSDETEVVYVYGRNEDKLYTSSDGASTIFANSSLIVD